MGVTALFDHLLNPGEHHYDAPPTENEATQVEELLHRFVRDEGNNVRDFIRRHPPRPTE
jgi:hypothetical protein